MCMYLALTLKHAVEFSSFGCVPHIHQTHNQAQFPLGATRSTLPFGSVRVKSAGSWGLAWLSAALAARPTLPAGVRPVKFLRLGFSSDWRVQNLAD